MPARKRNTRPKWVDPDDIPDTSGPEWDEAIAKGVLSHNGVVIRRGRPPVEKPKVSTTIRLDAEIMDHFKAGGPGWQTRVNDALRDWLSANVRSRSRGRRTA